MPKYAEIVDDLAMNVIVIPTSIDPDSFAAENLSGYLIRLSDFHDGEWGIGWRMVDGIPTPPPDPDQEPPIP